MISPTATSIVKARAVSGSAKGVLCDTRERFSHQALRQQFVSNCYTVRTLLYAYLYNRNKAKDMHPVLYFDSQRPSVLRKSSFFSASFVEVPLRSLRSRSFDFRRELKPLTAKFAENVREARKEIHTDALPARA
jgi:hypothetical protein